MVPITDGLKTTQVVVNLKKAVDTNGREIVREIEKHIALSIIDQEWKEHLRDMDDLRQSVQNAAYEQKDPLLVYKFESVELFKQFLSKVNADTIGFLMKANIPQEEAQPAPQQARRPAQQPQPKLQTNKQEEEEYADNGPNAYAQRMERQAPVRVQKIDRNARVTVQYRDGSMKKDVKYKSIENDIATGKAVVVA